MSSRSQCLLCPETPLIRAWTQEHHHRCPRCGLIHNLRSQDSSGEEARYHGVVFDTPAEVARQQWQWLESLGVRLSSGERIFDLGCGSGSFLVEAQARGLQVAGCDISRAAVERARERLGPQAQVECDWHALGGEFALITLWDVLDHLEQPLETLRALRQRLAPHGCIAVRVRNGPLHLVLRNLELRLRAWFSRPSGGRCLGVVHRYGFGPDSLRSLAQQAGFSKIAWARRVITTGKVDRTTGQGRWLQPCKWALAVFADTLSSLSRRKLVVNPSLTVLLRP